MLINNHLDLIPGITKATGVAHIGVQESDVILDIFGVTRELDLSDALADVRSGDVGGFLSSLHLQGDGNTAIVIGNGHKFPRAASNSIKAVLAGGQTPIVHEELLLTSRTLSIGNLLNLGGGTYNATSMDEVEAFFDVELNFNVNRDEDDDSLILRAPFAPKAGRILVKDDQVVINRMALKDTTLIWANSGTPFHPLAQRVLALATPVDLLRILMVVLKAAYEEGKSHKQLLGYLAGLASASAPGEYELSKLDEGGVRYRTTNVMGVLVLRTRPSHITTFGQPDKVNLVDAAEEMMLIDPYSLYTVTEKGEDLIRFTVEELLSGDNAWGLKLLAP